MTHANFDFCTGDDAAMEGTVLIDGVVPKYATVRVRVTRSDGIVAMFSTSSNENGRYRLQGIPAGSLECEINAQTPESQYLEPRFLTVETRSGQTTIQDTDVRR